MFKKRFHVCSCSACSACAACSQLVQGTFTRPEHANLLNMQLTAKMANIFLIMFHFSISCWGMFSVFRTEIKWKGKVSYEDKTSVLSWYFSTRLLNSKFRKQMDTLKYSAFLIYGCIFITDLPVLKAEKFNVIIIALKQVQEREITHRNRDWQGLAVWPWASSLSSSSWSSPFGSESVTSPKSGCSLSLSHDGCVSNCHCLRARCPTESLLQLCDFIINFHDWLNCSV